MTTLLSIWAAFTDWIVTLAESPRVHTAILVFLSILWTAIGITYLVDRRKPRLVATRYDYRYGLTFEGITPFYQPDDPEGVLGFGINVRNFTSGPIRYVVEVLDIRIGTRALPKVDKGKLTSIVQRGAGRTSTTKPFSANDIKDFTGQRVQGTATLSIVYGHPESEPVRRLSMEMGIVIQIKEDTREVFFGHDIREESDTAIT